ncbi:MAG: hypothetical protein IJN90_06830 [Bacilli bacterium]|nr:hypothetical protein [Bacilli bacterium]
MKTSSMIILPEIDDVDEKVINSEKSISNIRTLLYEHAIKVVNNTILKKYLTSEEIKARIEKYAKNIKQQEGIHYVGDPTFKKDTVLLSDHFFSSVVRNSTCQNSELNKYPEMIKLLEITGLTVACSNTVEDTPYNIGTQETRDLYLKTLIANYFATNYDKKEKRDIEFAGRTFKSYAVSNALQVNMIYVIASIVKDDILAMTLLSDTPEAFLSQAIDQTTNKKGTGEKLITYLKALNRSSKEMMFSESQMMVTQDFYDNKIYPFIEALKKQNKKMQIFCTTFLESNNFDIDDYNFHHMELATDVRFNKDDIEKIKYYINRFTNHCEQSKGQNTNFIDFFYTETPEVRKREDGWYEDDFSFVNKVVTEMNIDQYFYNTAVKNLDNIATKTMDFITETIIPLSLKNKKLNQTPEEFETMLSYLTFDNCNIEKSKKGQRKINKVKKKLLKNKREN